MTKLYSGIFIFVVLASCASEPKTENKTSAQEEALEVETTTEVDEISRSVLDPLFEFGTEEMLAMAFGEGNLTRKMASGPEGSSSFPTTSILEQTGEVTFNWAPEDTVSDVYEHLKSITTQSPEWETEEGIYVGMSLADLEALNGEPFSFYGFEWDYSGLCWFETGNLQERSPNLGIKLEPDPSKIRSEQYRKAMGKQILSSSDQLAKELRLRVSSIRILAPKTATD